MPPSQIVNKLVIILYFSKIYSDMTITYHVQGGIFFFYFFPYQSDSEHLIYGGRSTRYYFV